LSVPAPAFRNERLELVKLLHDVADLVFSDAAELLAEFDLTEPQASMLWALDPSSPPTSMREFARKLRCDPSNITLLGDQLEAAGLVERRADPCDGRRRVLTLTEKGLKVWSLILRRLEERSPLFALSAREQRQLAALLEKVQRSRSQVPAGFLD
jgi:DNA-binding MarR family transcriptional regulator